MVNQLIMDNNQQLVVSFLGGSNSHDFPEGLWSFRILHVSCSRVSEVVSEINLETSGADIRKVYSGNK